jgi:hypothetical protein
MKKTISTATGHAVEYASKISIINYLYTVLFQKYMEDVVMLINKHN